MDGKTEANLDELGVTISSFESSVTTRFLMLLRFWAGCKNKSGGFFKVFTESATSLSEGCACKGVVITLFNKREGDEAAEEDFVGLVSVFVADNVDCKGLLTDKKQH